jgi:hypothetical protein
MRLSPLLVGLFSSWMILHLSSADVYHSSAEEETETTVILPAKNQQEDQRDLQAPCPLGEEWNEYYKKCIAFSCDSQNACKFGETCTYVRRFCQGENIPCPQFRCDSPCPAYEQKDPITGQCVPISCSSPRACTTPGKVCLHTPTDNTCNPSVQLCSTVLCCDDISECDSLYCAYGRLNGPDGCPICDCHDCPGGGMRRTFICESVDCILAA